VKFARGSIHGDAVEMSARRRLTDQEKVKLRTRWIRTMRDQGLPCEEIGDIFRLKIRRVRQILRAARLEQQSETVQAAG
jgi:DNA-directed RNA polymerase sigma subunit (sigma70/sigma32)